MCKANVDFLKTERGYELKRGLGNWFDEGGQLSGGQWQKIALARTYYKNADLGDGKLQLNPMSYQVIYEGKEIDLTPREFEVLYLLAQRPNWVIPKKNIYCSVWESNYYDDQIPYKTVEHVVWKIRKKMGHDIIETLINVGYRLKKM